MTLLHERGTPPLMINAQFSATLIYYFGQSLVKFIDVICMKGTDLKQRISSLLKI